MSNEQQPDNLPETKRRLLDFLTKKIDGTIRYEGESYSISEMGNALYIKMLNGKCYMLELKRHIPIQVIEDSEAQPSDNGIELLPSAKQYIKRICPLSETITIEGAINMAESYAELVRQHERDIIRKKTQRMSNGVDIVLLSDI